MRKYDKDIDDFYSMDETPDVYLDDEQIQNALANIKIPNEEAELEAVEILKKSEQLHRDSLMGKLSDDECTKLIQEIEEHKQSIDYVFFNEIIKKSVLITKNC